MSKRKPRRRYSGKGVYSWEFWRRVNALPRNEGGETAYVLGCALQDLEERVLKYLDNAETKLRPQKKR